MRAKVIPGPREPRTSVRADARFPHALAAFLIVALTRGSPALAAPVGTAFTYQGVLENPPGQVVNDTCAFEFALCDDAVATCSPGTVSSHVGIEVLYGVFTVPDVDFGDDACNGEARWMEVSVQCSGDASFVMLSPRVELTPTPYALRAVEGVGPPAGIHVAENGNVGIGTTTPATKLHVAIAGYNGVFVEGNGTGDARYSLENGGGPHFIFDDDSDAHTLKIESAATRALAFNTSGPNERMRIDPAGNVGIGTATPQAQLDVNGAVRATTVEISGGSSYPPYPLPLIGWGQNSSGQLDVPPYAFTALGAGNDHVIGIRVDGTVIGWGTNDSGQANGPSGTFIAVTAGNNFSLGIRSDGTLAAWGTNNFGQTNVPSGTFIAVDAGPYHGLAIRDDGSLVAWGLNSGGTNVPSGTFVAAAAGNEFGIGIRDDGTLAGWGTNIQGVLSLPTGTFIAVDAGYEFAVGMRSDGTLVAWGGGGNAISTVPGGAFASVAAGWYHALAVRNDGTLAGWGLNDAGQTDVPTGSYSTVAAGGQFSVAIRSDPIAPNPALRLLVDSATKPGSNTWTIYSDRRLKKDIEPLSGALERLTQLRGVTFNWRDPASQGGITGTQMGLIADEVQRVFPQWVGRDAKGYQTLTVGGFEALTAEALRELRAEKDRQLVEKDCEIEALKARLSRLEALLGSSTTKKGEDQ